MTDVDFGKLAAKLNAPESLITDFTGLEQFLTDATDRQGQAAALVMAAGEDDVVATVRFCEEHSLPVIPRGAGTGLSGGCVPTGRGIVLSTENLADISVFPHERTAVCGPGAITKDLADMAASFGLAYPPDPASYDESTLGGNVAENAGGLRCKRFGVTRDYILGMRAVTAGGNIIETGSYIGNRGFNLGDLLIGSEGTLVILTETTVRLIAAPRPGITLLVAFDLARDAAQTVSDITGAGIIPTVMEFLDGDAALCSNEYEKNEGLDAVAAILLIESGGDNPDRQAARIADICKSNRCSYLRIESEPEKAEQLWKIRRNLSRATKELAKVRISEDVAVPNSKFPELVAYVADMNRTCSVRINSYGHAGDGNLHVNFLSSTGSASDLEAIDQSIDRLMAKTLTFGGTLTGEHGIGLEKKKYLATEFDSATIRTMKGLKAIFDPAGLLNPGKIFC